MTLSRLILPATWALALVSPAMAAPDVVVSIKPIHSLVSAVMQGIGAPHLIVRGSASPHTFSLRPSDAGALGEAELVVWVGPDMENFLDGTITTLATQARVLEVSALPGIDLLPLREGASFEAHDHGHEDEHEHDHEDDHEHDHEKEHAHEGEHGHDDHAEQDEHDHHDDEHEQHEAGHDHGAMDMHLWLAPQNAISIVLNTAEVLSELDPENSADYRSNADATIAQLQVLAAELTAQLAPLANVPFVTFHDAYQYFETSFGVSAAGAITLNPESQPGARRIAEVRDTIIRLEARCVFAEPQFEPALVATVTEGTDARTGTLDPVGADLDDGPDLYFALMRRMADNMQACLTP